MFLETVRDSPSLEMINLVLEKISRGEKPVSLAIGEPSFDTPKEIVQAAYKASLRGTRITYPHTEYHK